MPYRRRLRRKFVRRPRRFIRYRRRIPRPRFNNRVHNFKQFAEIANINVAAGTQTFFQYAHQLSDIPNSATLVSLYDQYRIMAVKMTFWPYFTDNQPGASSSLQIYTALDFDFTGLTLNLSVLDQYTSLKRRQFIRPHSRYYKPMNTMAMTSANTTTVGSANARHGTWLDCANSNIPYYGIIGGIVGAAIPACTVRVTATYYIQFKNVR